MDVVRRIGRGASSFSNTKTGRICGAIASRFANRRLVFTLGAVSILGSKCIHIYAHLGALPTSELMRWGLSFFAQDTALMLLLRVLFDADLALFVAYRYVRYLAMTLGSLLVVFHLLLATINIGFYIMAGSELHWRNIGFAGGGGSGSWGVLLSGLFACGLGLAVLLVVSWVVQDVCYGATGIALDLLCKPFAFVLRKVPCFSQRPFATIKYENIPQKDVDLESIRDKDEDDEDDNGYKRHHSRGPDTPSSSSSQRAGRSFSRLTWVAYAIVAFLLVAQVVLSIMRPNEGSLSFMSWTAALLPFIDFAHSSPVLSDLLPHYGNSIGWGWDNQTALGEPVAFSWLPKDKHLAGFDDWYVDGSDHYNARLDPLKIDNLDSELLEALRGKLDGVDIRHVVLLKLESTRQDVFPIRRDGLILKTLEETWDGGKFPPEVEQELAHLTPTANYLTGDYDDGLEHNDTSARGGLVYTNDHTTGTYTLKSLPGTMCGINPLVVDFNNEYDNHIYQPCLAHIFDAFNELDKSKKDSGADAYTKYKWNNSFMTSVTGFYDKQDLLMGPMGYGGDQLVYKEFLQSDNATFGKVTLPEINYYGMAEVAIDDYIVDAFKTAREKNERVFFSHITSTAHHPFKIPDGEPWANLAPDGKLGDLVGYTNAISYVDSWLRRILDILDEQDAANNTLVVLVGDHGLSVPETGGVTPYYQPNIGSFHVPLVFSHPKLPQITMNGSVNSISVLPTILDLLIETGSLDPADRAAAKDLVRNYEGQSLIRPYRDISPKTGLADWQFTVMNPGRAQISTRSPLHPDFRLVAPVVKDIEWRFTNLKEDPHETAGVLNFDFVAFLKAVEKKYGREAAEWAEEAAFMTRWWVEENHKRWRYTA